MPFYLATREFFRLARERLAPGGMVALNVATVPGDHRLARGRRGDARGRVPGGAATWQALRFNQLVLGFDRPAARARSCRRRLARSAATLAPLTRLARGASARRRRPRDPWTDDRSPVEWITDRMIVEYAAEGGRLDETAAAHGAAVIAGGGYTVRRETELSSPVSSLLVCAIAGVLARRVLAANGPLGSAPDDDRHDDHGAGTTATTTAPTTTTEPPPQPPDPAAA